MNLKQFKEHIEKFPEGHCFKFGVSEPFAWRGYYAEVAFNVEMESMTKEVILERIETSLNMPFFGWKGGKFYYNLETPVNFEYDRSEYTNGDYCDRRISEIKEKRDIQSKEHELVTLAFF